MDTEKQKKENTDRLSGRILWLDVLKGFLIYFVLLSHSYPPVLYRRFFTPFFLTMFFFVSGYTFSVKDNFFVFFQKKCRRLVIPLFVLGGIRMAVCLFIDRGSFVKRFCGLLLQRSGVYDEMWFLSCLFVSCMIFYLILTLTNFLCRIRLHKSHVPAYRSTFQQGILLTVSLCFMILGFADILIFKIKFPWEAELACAMTGYTSLGYCYRQNESRITAHGKKLPLTAAFVVYFFIVILFPNDVDIHMEEFSHLSLFLVSSLLCILPIIQFCKFLTKTAFCRILSFLGKNSLFYFAFGGFVRIIFYAITNHFGISNEFLLPLLCSFFTVILPAYPAMLVHRHFPWMVGEVR